MTRARIGAAVAVWLAITLVLWAGGSRPAVIALGAVVAVVAVLAMVLVDVTDAVAGVGWTRRRDDGRSALGTERWVQPLRTELERGRRYGSTGIHDALVELVDDRLLSKHRIDRARDPGAAAAVLPPALRRLTAEAPRPLTSVRDLRTILDELDAL